MSSCLLCHEHLLALIPAWREVVLMVAVSFFPMAKLGPKNVTASLACLCFQLEQLNFGQQSVEPDILSQTIRVEQA